MKGLIGEGSFGKVFRTEREDFGVKYEAALKVITIPQNQSEINSLRADGMDGKDIEACLEQLASGVVSEVALMAKREGNSNVVSYEDHAVMKRKDDTGWDILIRMELLTNLTEHITRAELTAKDAIKLGIDICKALEFCQRYQVIHRDIKPENIFVSGNGDYKLGDFGVARNIEKTMSGLSKKGTNEYMAPEVYKGEDYGTTVGIYSLGIVMYKLLNQNRIPFLPAYPAPVTNTDREEAFIRRMRGEKIEPPRHSAASISELILKACEFRPKNRYAGPAQMREALEAVTLEFIPKRGGEKPDNTRIAF